MYTLVGDVDNRVGYVCVKERNIWEISVLSIQICCEPKAVLKNKEYFKKRAK